VSTLSAVREEGVQELGRVVADRADLTGATVAADGGRTAV
jgi:hypothetical protein